MNSRQSLVDAFFGNVPGWLSRNAVPAGEQVILPRALQKSKRVKAGSARFIVCCFDFFESSFAATARDKTSRRWRAGCCVRKLGLIFCDQSL